MPRRNQETRADTIDSASSEWVTMEASVAAALQLPATWETNPTHAAATAMRVDTQGETVDGAAIVAALWAERQTDESKRQVLSDLRQIASALQINDPAAVPWGELWRVALAPGRSPPPWGQRSLLWSAAVNQLRNALMEGRSPDTVNRLLVVLRRALRKAYLAGALSDREWGQVTEVKPARGSRVTRGRHVSQSEIRALFVYLASEPGPRARRDEAILALAFGLGLRRAELAALNLADYDASTHLLRVMGKGNKQRELPLTPQIEKTLDRWLRVRGKATGTLFCAINRGGELVPNRRKTTDNSTRPSAPQERAANSHGDNGVWQRLTGDAVLKMLADRQKQAGVSAFSPHDARRTFISELLDGGADIATAADLAGHADIATTRRYDRRGTTAKKKAVALLDLPMSG